MRTGRRVARAAAPVTTALLLALLLALLHGAAAASATLLDDADDSKGRHDYTLAHVMHHGANTNPRFLARIDLDAARHGPLPTYRGIAHRHRRLLARDVALAQHQNYAPDPSDKQTVLQLAEMSWNAYENRNTSTEWKVITGYNLTAEFGWTGDGMRGYVYANADRSIVIMAIKGTSLTFLGIGGPTSEKDLIVDNLMFSCCCARINSRWDTVCDCYRGPGDTCSQRCLESTVQNNSLSYYQYAEDIYSELKRLYPTATIWVTGHSLGASLASLVAFNNNLAAFGYEAPGELLYGQRLGFKIDANDMGRYPIYHFGNTGDPIFLGLCTGVASSCSVGGYALETGCHIGNICVYDNPSLRSVNEHRLAVVIDKLIVPMPVPKCYPQNGCRDCSDWSFV